MKTVRARSSRQRPGSAALSTDFEREPGVLGLGQRHLGDGVDPGHPGHLGGAVAWPASPCRTSTAPARDATRCRGRTCRARAPPRRGRPLADRRVDHLQHEHALARVGGHADPAVADAPLGVGQRHQRAAAGVAEQHDGLGAPPAHLGRDGLDVDDARLVQAVGVVAHVAGAEAARRVARRGQERAGVVHREVASRVAEDDRRLRHLPVGREPQEAPHEGAVGAHEADRLPRELHPGIVLGERPVAVAERALPTQVDVEVCAHGSAWPPLRFGRARSLNAIVAGASLGAVVAAKPACLT